MLHAISVEHEDQTCRAFSQTRECDSQARLCHAMPPLRDPGDSWIKFNISIDIQSSVCFVFYEKADGTNQQIAANLDKRFAAIR